MNIGRDPQKIKIASATSTGGEQCSDRDSYDTSSEVTGDVVAAEEPSLTVFYIPGSLDVAQRCSDPFLRHGADNTPY